MWGIADFIVKLCNKLVQDTPCQACAVYREWLEKETHHNRYLLKKLLDKETIEDVDINDDDYEPVISRHATLSQLRRMAELHSLKKSLEPSLDKEDMAVPARDEELTEAELVFQKELEKTHG